MSRVAPDKKLTACTAKPGTSYERCGPIAVPERSPLIFIHGVGMTRHFWKPQVQEFAGAYPVILYDTFGHGESALPPKGGDLQDYVDQLSDLMDALHVGRANIIGHSMGALIATGFALTHPSRCEKLIAMMGIYDRSPEHIARTSDTAARLAKEGPETVFRSTLARWFSEEDRLDSGRQDAIGKIERILSQTNPEGYARAYRVFAESGERFCGRLQDLQMPSLFMTAELDPNSSPAMSRKMANAAPKGYSAILADERHMASFVAPQKTNPVLASFLAWSGKGRWDYQMANVDDGRFT